MHPLILTVLAAIALSAPSFGQRVVTTIAGTDWLFPGDGRPALNAPLSGALGLDVALDVAGNLYFADTGNAMAMRLGADGIINVIAGNGVNFKAGDGGLAINAALLLPISIALDGAGNVYIGEYGGRIRKLSTDGIITTIAGTDISGFSGDNGPATQAQLYAPYGIAVGWDGSIYISDSLNNRIRRIAASGIITTIAGTGTAGLSGDGGAAVQARLNQPTRIAVDGDNNVYFIDSLNARVRKIDSRGNISTFAGGGDPSLPTARAFLFPSAVAVDRTGSVYVVDALSQGIDRIDLQGNVSLIGGGTGKQGFSGDGGPARSAVFFTQLYTALAVDAANNVYISDDQNNRIRKIGIDGTVRTVAGNGLYHNSGNGGPATSATLDLPTGIARDPAGNLYVAEPVFNRIRKIAADGTISVYAGNGIQGYSGDGGPATQASLGFPNYLYASTDGYLIFTESYNCVLRIIDPKGIITTLIGSGTCGYNGEGTPSNKTSFKAPYGFDIAFPDPNTLLIAIADTQNHRIRVVPTSTGLVVTAAGTGAAGFSGDGGPATSAKVNNPVGVRFFGDSLYFCDAGNHRVRRIDSNLIITTVAGNGSKGYSGDNGPAAQASLNSPQSITFDSAGNMYIADQGNSAIRRVAAVNGVPRGTITTFAGGKFPPTLGDGGLATEAFLGAPADLLFDPAGNLIFSDQFNNRVRAVLAAPPSFTISPDTLAFTAAAGSNASDQRVEVVGSIPGVGFGATVSAPTWLSVSFDAGVMPATLRVVVTPGNLAPGAYQGTVTILAPTANPSSRTINVTLTVSPAGAPNLSVNPNYYSFAFVRNGASLSRPLQIANVGSGNIAFTVAVAAAAGGRQWLATSSPTGTVGPYGTSVVNLTANPTGLAAGTYSGTVTVLSANPAQSVTVPVTMTVSDVQQTILVPQSGLSFFAVQGGGAPPGQFFNILNIGEGSMSWTVRASTTTGSNWLSAFPGTGATDAASSIVPQVRVDVDPTNLKAGIYYGSIQVTAPGADNNPQFISVILNVLPPSSSIGPIVQPAGLVFVAVAGAQPPGSQTVIVQNTGNSPVTFRSGRITVDGKPWLTTLPSDATVTQALPVRIVVQPRTEGLAPNAYRGTLTLSFSDGTTRNVAILLVVVPAGSTIRPFSRPEISGCTPKALLPVFTLTSAGTSVPAGYPGAVAVKVVDDCGNPMTNGGVIVSFSNGDPPIRLISLKDGTWAGTWTPGHIVSQITITATASAPEQNLKGDVSIKVGLSTFDQPPVIGVGGILNTASYALQAPIAPGSFISLFGSKLATQDIAGSVPLPEELGGASVVIAGRLAPVYFTSDAQIIALVPYGIAVNTTHQVIVSRGSSLSVPQPITISAAAPGIFTRNAAGTGQGSITDASNRVADAANPVRAGDTIVIYCTGLGEVTPGVPAGTAAPLDHFTRTVNDVTVSIGGQDAKVPFAGLTPGSFGLYQVNAVVPNGVVPGPAVPVTISAAGQTSPPATIVVRQ
jgi:uncharacterized protein (TIGR03437 family)